MSPTDLAIHDIARELCSVDAKSKNRHDIFVVTLRSFLDVQLEHYRRGLLSGSIADYAKFEEIRKSAKEGKINKQ